jgi:NAD(P)-dependent dehydrogenase (short-subunit alcohol dehydrogenase family)
VTIAIDHTDKVVLVTGSGAGIGREIARWFARAGAAVAVTDVRKDKADAVVGEIEAEGGRAVALVADLRDDEQIERLVADAVAQLGGLDIAVNNVGNLGDRMPAPFLETDGAHWREIVDQNLLVTALSARAEAQVMVERGGGVILNVSSGETTRPSPFMAPYGAAKNAINHLTQTMAVELGPLGIRVNAIAPGTTLTEKVREVYDDDRVAEIVASTALRRMVEHDELARLSVFLASDLARCITGQFILADAGAFLSRTRPANTVPTQTGPTTEGDPS